MQNPDGGLGRNPLAVRALLATGCLTALAAGGCRYGYDLLSLEGQGASSSASGGQGAGGSSRGGMGGSGIATGGASSANLGGEGGVNSDGGATVNSGGSGNATGTGGGTTGGDSGSGPAAGEAGTSSGSAGSGNAPSVGGASSGSAGLGSGGSPAGGSSAGGSAGSSSGGTTPDLANGYWLLDAADQGGKGWTLSSLVFTSAVTNPDSTIALTYRVDWFEDAGSFGILLGGEEVGVGTFYPTTSTLTLDQTGGWEPDTLDHYEATYDPDLDQLVDGFWNTGSIGTFSAVRVLEGNLLGPLTATASSTRSSLVASNAVDTDMMTAWSSANGRTTGEVLTLTLSTPARLRGLRILSYVGSTDAAPARLSVTSRDGTGADVDVSDVLVPADEMWKPVLLNVDTPVSEVELVITEIQPASGNRVMVSGVELFGLLP